VSKVADVGEELSFELDRLGQRARLARERMPPPRLGETLDQGVRLRVEHQEADVPARLAQRRECLAELRDAVVGAQVERDGDAFLSRATQVLDRLED